MAKSPLVIKNETRYSTRDLRRFFTAGLRHLGAQEGRTITVVYHRRGWQWAGTHASYWPGTHIKMTLPKIPAQLSLLDMARIFEHEVGHTLGLRHREMPSWSTLTPTWHEGLTIRYKAPAPRVVVPVAERREVRARAHLVRLEKQLVRTQRLLRKWRGKVRYYDNRNERRAAATISSHRGEVDE